MFQFTHPGGVRLLSNDNICFVVVVSIHAPGRGATASNLRCVCRDEVSIHAPGRGATLGVVQADRIARVSIHAPGRGATGVNEMVYTGRRCFNSRTREGCDSNKVTTNLRQMVSIHAPGRGATGASTALRVTNCMFQFTHPGGVRLKKYLESALLK